MARKIYYVSPSDGRWKVTDQGTTLSEHHTKDAAIEAGRTTAKAYQPSQLVMQHADGTLETQYTYGDDPFPPKG